MCMCKCLTTLPLDCRMSGRKVLVTFHKPNKFTSKVFCTRSIGTNSTGLFRERQHVKNRIRQERHTPKHLQTPITSKHKSTNHKHKSKNPSASATPALLTSPHKLPFVAELTALAAASTCGERVIPRISHNKNDSHTMTNVTKIKAAHLRWLSDIADERNELLRGLGLPQQRVTVLLVHHSRENLKSQGVQVEGCRASNSGISTLCFQIC